MGGSRWMCRRSTRLWGGRCPRSTYGRYVEAHFSYTADLKIADACSALEPPAMTVPPLSTPSACLVCMSQGLLQSEVARRQLRNATSVRLLLDRAPVLLDMSPKLRELMETSNGTDGNKVAPFPVDS